MITTLRHTLSPKHDDSLARLRIAPELSEVSKLQSLNDSAAGEKFGLHGHRGANLDGIFFTYFHSESGHHVGARWRFVPARRHLAQALSAREVNIFIADLPLEPTLKGNDALLAVAGEYVALWIPDLFDLITVSSWLTSQFTLPRQQESGLFNLKEVANEFSINSCRS